MVMNNECFFRYDRHNDSTTNCVCAMKVTCEGESELIVSRSGRPWKRENMGANTGVLGVNTGVMPCLSGVRLRATAAPARGADEEEPRAARKGDGRAAAGV